MDDIGNIVYLIVLALSFVVGIWQKANKKSESGRTEEADPMEDPMQRMEEIFRGREFAPSQEEVEAAQAKDLAAAKRLEEMERKAEEAKSSRGISKRKSRQLQVEEIGGESRMEHPASVLDLDDFDARKAVIYSEILNPPYL